MMATCNGHYLSFFWCHTLVNRMQLGLHWCVAGRCPVRTQGSKVRVADNPQVSINQSTRAFLVISLGLEKPTGSSLSHLVLSDLRLAANYLIEWKTLRGAVLEVYANLWTATAAADVRRAWTLAYSR